MGSYLNPGSERFQTSLRSEIYVDKSLLIAQVNHRIRTEQKFICLSRPRRFGKSMAADMLSAYYGRGEDTAALFDGLKIASADSYRAHLNQYDVIKINMQQFLSTTHDVPKMREALQKRVLKDLALAYPDIADGDSLSCVIGLAFYYAREYYTIIREMPSGKGFADIFFIPRPLNADKPAAVIELKKDKDAQGAIAQIKQKNYVKALEDYKGNLLLVGINYDAEKKHSCVIEKWQCE